MRVYYVGSGMQGCYVVRALLPLQANGWDGDLVSINPLEKTGEAKAKAAMHADVVVFHRPENPDKLQLARHLRAMGKKIVFDNDDTYKDHEVVKLNKFMDEQRVVKGLEKINKVVDTFIQEADLVTTSTEFLADEYRKLNDNVIVLPNCVDPFLFDEPLRNESDKIRIGITGSVGLTTDLDIMEPIFRHYENDPRVQLVFFSLMDKSENMVSQIYEGEYRILESLDVEWHPMVPMNQYYEKLNELRLDIQIIPRADNYFNRCKSNLKFLESSMFEIPCIAQGFADNKSPYHNDRDYMLLAYTHDEWIKHIDELINDKEKRSEMGRKARAYVEDKYSIDNNVHLWENAYNTIL
jgi:glycosyltransferase involved in cell wall biosynthesis